MKSDKYKKLAHEWFDIAENDLGYAKLGMSEDKFYAQVAFQAQQAAEKYLKGFLTLHGKKFRKTHDLVELIELCKSIEPDFISLKEQADILSPYAVDIRYPVHYPLIERKHAEEAIKASETIIELIKDKIKERK